MRIIGYIDNKDFKITVFQNNNRFLIKFEDSYFEQTYKFMQSDHIKHFKDIEKLVDLQFILEVRNTFLKMYDDKEKMIQRFIQFESDDLIEII